MKTLVVGSSSSVGRALIPVLSEFSEVVTAGRTNCDITIVLGDPSVNYTLPDHIDVLIHTAANFGGGTDKEILEAELVNTVGTLKLCQAAVNAKVKHFILISSIFTELSIDSQFHSVYALSKKHSEEMAKFYCSKHSLPLTILRPSQIYGNEDHFRRHQPFIYAIADKAQNGENITLFGSHDPLRNFIYIDDLTTIIVKTIQNRVEGIYPCAHPDDVAFSEIVKAALDAFNSDASLLFLKDKADMHDNVFKKDNSLYEIIDFYPQISIKLGMKKIADYRKKLT